MVFAFSAVTACSAKDKVSDSVKDELQPTKASGDWSAKMQELSSALHKLLPLVVSSKDFDNPANAAAIEDATNRLKKLSHQVRNLEKPAADPAFDSIAKMLDEDLARAGIALRSGNRDYARLTIRESIGYCIQCHTQAANGPRFPKLELGFDPTKMSALGQGDYYAATRQFDSALKAYRQGVQDSGYAKKDIFGWERAARSGLAIAVRLDENPKEARVIAQAIVKNKSAPESLKSSAKAWLKEIERWAFEPKNLFKGENARLDRAEALIANADKVVDAEGKSQDISYLRASSDLHQWLSQHPLIPGQNQADRAKALFLAGRAAEESRELNFWTLHERYYELCIETKPASDIAKKCFKKLNDSVLMGYTGSGGLHLPSEESARLARLKEKADGK
jgi:hypothetical protein